MHTIHTKAHHRKTTEADVYSSYHSRTSFACKSFSMFFQNSPLPTDSIVNAHCEHGTVSADPREAGRAFIARLAATATNHGEIASTSPAQPYGHVLLPLQPAMHPTPNATPHRTAAGICIHPQPGDELNAAIPTGNESLCYNSIDVEEHRSLPRLPRRCSPPHISKSRSVTSASPNTSHPCFWRKSPSPVLPNIFPTLEKHLSNILSTSGRNFDVFILFTSHLSTFTHKWMW